MENWGKKRLLNCVTRVSKCSGKYRKKKSRMKFANKKKEERGGLMGDERSEYIC